MMTGTHIIFTPFEVQNEKSIVLIYVQEKKDVGVPSRTLGKVTRTYGDLFDDDPAERGSYCVLG